MAEQKKSLSEEIDELISQNYGLIVSQAKKFHPKNRDVLEEYIQVGCVGIVKAINTFNSDISKFSTYACRCIFNEIYSFVVKNNKHQNLVNEEIDIPSINKENIDDYLPDYLTEQEKLIIVMKINNFSKKEIAEKIGENEKVTTNIINKIMKKIKNANKTKNINGK